MKYMSTVQASAVWNITPHRIAILAREGRIPGAVQIGSRWMLPADAAKPADTRTKAAKANEKNDTFCFRFYEKRAESSFSPPLSEEEIKIRRASDAFFACRFEESAALLGALPQTAKNRYVRIMALYSACMLGFVLNRSEMFLSSYGRLCAALEEDFPHRQEMLLLLSELNATLGDIHGFVRDFSDKRVSAFHPDCLSHLSALSVVALFYGGIDDVTKHDLLTAEINCALLESTTDNMIDLQTLHLYLGLMNEMTDNKEAKRGHLRRAFELAEQYELYWLPAMQYYYMGASFDEVLNACSPAFAEKIRALSEDIHRRREDFMRSSTFRSFFELIGAKQYLYAFYAAQGFTGREVAKRMHLAESTVKKTYAAIYQSLGIQTKKELVDFYRGTGHTEP